MFFYYKSFKTFIDDYPRFKVSSISFDILKTRIKRIRNWFTSDKCLLLPPTDVCSKVYWKKYTIQLRNPTAAIDFDHNQTFKHEGITSKGEVDNEYQDVPGQTETETETDKTDDTDGDGGNWNCFILGDDSEHGSLNDMDELKSNLPQV